MSVLRSLGLAQPAGLSFLVAEGILPPDPAPTSYRWLQTTDLTHPTLTREELLLTERCVIWSRGGVVRRVLRFEAENETVRHALFAYFPADRKGDCSPAPADSSIDHGAAGLVPPWTRRPERVQSTPSHTGQGQSKLCDAAALPLERALVVVLVTQAHIFSSSANHVIHLPFETREAFAVSSGLIIQGTPPSQTDIKPTPQVPSAPFNSFAFTSDLPTSMLSSTSVDTKGNFSTSRTSFLTAFAVPTQPSLDRTPSHQLFISDPLAEPKLIYTETQSKKRAGYENLSAEESIVASCTPPLQGTVNRLETLLLTQNTTTSELQLWQASLGCAERKALRHVSRSSADNRNDSRRRKSRGLSTGASTPGLLAPLHQRTSLSTSQSRRAGSTGNLEEHDVASQLDPAFEKPGATGRSSRRISSLLARSEVPAGRDSIALIDTATSFAGSSNARGSFKARKSLGLSSSQRRSSHRSKSGHLDHSHDLSDHDEDMNGFTCSEPDSDMETEGLDHHDRLESPPKTDLSLKRIISLNPVHSWLVEPRNSSYKIFALAVSIADPSALAVSILDRQSQILYTTTIQPTQRYSNDASQTTRIPSKSFDERRGVLDACQIGTGSRTGLILLQSSPAGQTQLSLWTPGDISERLKMPSDILLLHPYDIGAQRPFRTRKSSFRRVLSDPPLQFSDIRSDASSCDFEMKSVSGSWYRFSIQFAPTSPFVAKLIAASDAVRPQELKAQFAMSLAWSDAFSRLQAQSAYGTIDNELTSFVLALFILISPLLPLPEPTLPVKRARKSLARSGSGANVDQEAFKAMMDCEDVSCTRTSVWLQSTSWEWASGDSHPNLSLGPTSKIDKQAGSPSLRQPLQSLMRLIEDAQRHGKAEHLDAVNGEAGAAFIERGLLLRYLSRILVILRFIVEDEKLDTLALGPFQSLLPPLAQIGGWLGWEDWSWRSPETQSTSVDLERLVFESSTIRDAPAQPFPPLSILDHVLQTFDEASPASYIDLDDLFRDCTAVSGQSLSDTFTPRSKRLQAVVKQQASDDISFVAMLASNAWTVQELDRLPEAIAAVFRAKLARNQKSPSNRLSSAALSLIDRSDVAMLTQHQSIHRTDMRGVENALHQSVRDYHTTCTGALEVDQVGAFDGQAEGDRLSLTRLVFRDDQRFAEAANLLHPLKPTTAQCTPRREWSDTDLLEAQQELVKLIALRTLSVSPGRGMIYFCARYPLLTERFPIHGFSLTCVMKPSNTTVTADRTIFTEEKVSWAFFHAGVEAGLSISKAAKGIDTSWISFNKPSELNNRHAGFLLALGLNGHLKAVAKWVAFKYLTPKHTMTSIGLLLGLAASYVGTMDTLITRLLSVHVTRMLPPGAAELNLSPLTQTTGIMAIGLLYCNTQHRRMSEIMLSEMENTDEDDSINPIEDVRDEGYRLAAGFAFGFINLGQGRQLKGLRDMHVVERLLALAVASKPVGLVHIIEKATAAATVAIALTFMKTGDRALARKIDVPDTVHQFEYVRPDTFLLRTVARHLILWDDIEPTRHWMTAALPSAHRSRARLTAIRKLQTTDLSLFNILAGLCLSLGLRFAGSARQDVRDLLLRYLDQFMRLCRLRVSHYDERLTRITVRNCQDVTALSVAAVMVGTGDLAVFRRLRSLHGRSDAETPFGSHLAAHQAIGLLFIGGGTYSLQTTDRAVAALLCAFYPLMPTSVLDNRCHLQAFRHLWVLAAEPRCLVVRHAETHRPLTMPIQIHFADGREETATAPYLLPPLSEIAVIKTLDSAYWTVTLNLAGDVEHRAAFARHQSLFVRRRPVDASTGSLFSSALKSLNAAQMAHQRQKQALEWIFTLPSFADLDHASRSLVLPPLEDAEGHASALQILASSIGSKSAAGCCTPADDYLVMTRECMESGKASRIFNLKILFAWAQWAQRQRSRHQLASKSDLQDANEGYASLAMGWWTIAAIEELRARILLRGATE